MRPATLAVDALAPGVPLAAHGGMRGKIPHLASFFGGRPVLGPGCAGAGAVLGWGNRLSGRKAGREAAQRALPLLRLEDGFLRSAGLGKTGAPTVSLAVDDRGVFYDASAPSRLEAILRAGGDCPDAVLARARAGMALWRDARLSKYNTGADRDPGLPDGAVVLVDQVLGDAFIAGAGADAATFAAMLDAALARHEAGKIVIRAHPDVIAGKARGFLAGLARGRGLALVDARLSSPAVLDGAGEIWTVSSQLGFEAMLRGVPVTSFGMPFYAGWGLTDDRATGPVALAARARRRACGLEAMFAGCFFDYVRYADPVTRRALDFEGAAARIVDWRGRLAENAATATVCFGFSAWKRRAAEVFLGGDIAMGGRPTARAALRTGKDTDRVAVWGMTDRPGFAANVLARGQKLVRVEDGFLRSVGLGSDLRMPGSLVTDDLGMYYDARGESRLERIVERGDMSSADVARAVMLRQRLVAEGVSKYNLAPAGGDLRARAAGRPVALVAEQVPGDAALRFGGGTVDGNLGLLRAVRDERPAAFIVYKEHPDLVAGNRRGRIRAARLLEQADMVVSDGDILGLFGAIDELHVVSSLAGFEALLRGIAVTAWGRPFYAGWGLTRDKMDFPRRSRRATLDELVAAALIVYPRYAEPLSGVPCSVEDFLAALVHLRGSGGLPPPKAGLLRQMLRLGRWIGAAVQVRT